MFTRVRPHFNSMHLLSQVSLDTLVHVDELIELAARIGWQWKCEVEYRAVLRLLCCIIQREGEGQVGYWEGIYRRSEVARLILLRLVELGHVFLWQESIGKVVELGAIV